MWVQEGGREEEKKREGEGKGGEKERDTPPGKCYNRDIMELNTQVYRCDRCGAYLLG